MKIAPFHTWATLAFLIIVPLAVVGCGAKEDSAVAPQAPETTSPTAPSVSKASDSSLAKGTQPADSSALDSLVLESKSATKESSDSQVSTAEPVGSDSQSEAKLNPAVNPDEVAAIEDAKADGPEEAAMLLTSYAEYGFTLKLDLGAEQLETIVANIQADFFAEFDPSVVGGIFTGLDHDQIGGFDHETLEAVLEAAGANLLGGLGDFDAIAGAATAFDELANLANFGEALEQDGSFVIQDGAFNFFGGNLFGFN